MSWIAKEAMRHTVVTGGAGFIGSHLVDALLARGDMVTVLDDFSTGQPGYLPHPHYRLRLVVGRIQDRSAVTEAIVTKAHATDTVYHLAAMSRSGPSDALMKSCVSDNIEGTSVVLEVAKEAGVACLVYPGSATYYGLQPGPHREDMRPWLLNPYAWSKYAGEELCLMYRRRGWLETVVLRYFSVYGHRQPTSGPEALVMGKFLEAARWGRDLEIHGDGSQRRDFVHVSDVVRATLLAGEWRTRVLPGPVINVGTGVSTSVQELADMMAARSYQVQCPPRVGDPVETLADTVRARALGFEARVKLADEVAQMRTEAV